MTTSPSTGPLAPVLSTLTADPGRPRLTWYGTGGERIELSGHVLDNWVAKTANLLVEEFDAGPGTRVLLDLPAHWRTVVWALAVWRVGSCVVLVTDADTGAGQGCDVVVTHRPTAFAGLGPGADLVAVALPALARRFAGDLPVGATDAAAAVMTYGDVLTWAPSPDLAADALAVRDQCVSHQDLLGWATTHRLATPLGAGAGAGNPRPATARGTRALLEPGDGQVAAVLAAVLDTYRADGSVVLVDPEVGAQLATDPERRGRLATTERVTLD